MNGITSVTSKGGERPPCLISHRRGPLPLLSDNRGCPPQKYGLTIINECRKAPLLRLCASHLVTVLTSLATEGKVMSEYYSVGGGFDISFVQQRWLISLDADCLYSCTNTRYGSWRTPEAIAQMARGTLRAQTNARLVGSFDSCRVWEYSLRSKICREKSRRRLTKSWLFSATHIRLRSRPPSIR